MAHSYSLTSLSLLAESSSLFLKLRTRLLQNLQASEVLPNSLIALNGSSTTYIFDTDTEREFYHEAFSFHVSGITSRDFFLLIEIDTNTVHVFVPNFDEITRTFLVPDTPESIQEKYGYKGYYSSQLGEVLASLSPTCIYLNKGKNTDSGSTTPASFLDLPELKAYRTDDIKLYEIFARTRSTKLPEEIELMRRIIRAASEGHVEIMRRCRPEMYEYSLAGIFRGHISTNYGHIYAFTPIAAAGNSGATLHYPTMDRKICDGDMVLCDMGGYAFGWSSDIACTFPANGKFTEKQRNIYNLVLKANRAVVDTMRPGTEWTDMHLLAERIIIEGLIELGVLVGDPAIIQEKRIGAVFFPHGLGHLLGQDVHDVGGYICGHTRSTQPGLKCLRTRRVLVEGMVITVEPGCYFIDFAIDAALNDPELREYFGEGIREYRGFGGVRIEDDVLVTDSAAEILTDVPRTVEGIEAAMAGGDWRALG